MPKRHALIIEWSGEHGKESSSTGFCRCGWSESCSSQKEVRNEYRNHLKAVKGRTFEVVNSANAKYAQRLFDERAKK